MSRRWLAVLALIAAFAVCTPALRAEHGWGRGKGEHGKRVRDKEHGRPHAREAARRGHREEARWERRGSFEYRSFDRGGRPPGWVRGRKVGWMYCGLPPGQARKYGCYSYVYQRRRYYYYHDDVGRLVVRRPTIIVHAGVDIVQ